MARPNNIPLVTDDRALGGSTIERSLRFNDNDSAHLSRTPSGHSNKKIWTISAWIKRANISGDYTMFNAYDGGSSRRFLLSFNSDDKLFYNQGGTSSTGLATSNKRFRDPGAWYHFVFRAKYTNVLASDRFKVYVNGSEISLSFSDDVENADGQWNGNWEHEIGAIASSGNTFDGYMTEIHHIDGEALQPTDFGYTDFQTGIWRPKKYEGTYGTHGFYLNFSDNSATTAVTLGKDRSGQGNNFTPTNFSVSAGTGNDSLEDTPTNNFCTLNSLDKKNTSIQNGNLTVTQASDPARIRGTFSMRPDTGKWYYEMQVGSGSSYIFGMKSISATMASITEDYGYYGYNGNKNVNGSSSSYGASYSAGDTVAILYDSDKHTVNFYKNNADQGQITGVSATTEYLPWVYLDNYGTAPNVHFNFGQRPFTYTPPTGYKTLNSNNLSPNVPSIINPKKHFGTLLYTGTGSTQSITGLEFQPNFVWIKKRNVSAYHQLFDTVRGATKGLFSNIENAEYQDTGNLQSFIDGGFTADGFNGTNASGGTYVAWCWKAGGAAVANNDGSTASQVSANTTAGFSIITYTGTGSTTTVGHGLGVAPQVVITKARNGAYSWAVLHTVGDPNAEYGLFLNDNGGYSSHQGNFYWNDTVPTSSVFTVKSKDQTNRSGTNYVAYCWSEISGYSKFGKYTGNGNADGTFVFTGFRPAFVLVKCSTSGEHWNIPVDTSSTNGITKTLSPNLTNAERDVSGGDAMDFLSNGFKIRNSDGNYSNNNATFIYFAFAEQPGNTSYSTETNAR